jgi:hypothetical protein
MSTGNITLKTNAKDQKLKKYAWLVLLSFGFIMDLSGV